MQEKKQKKAIKNVWHLLVLSGVTVAAVMILSTFCFSVSRVRRAAVSSTLAEGELLLNVKQVKVERGDLVAFYYGNEVVIRRCIGIQGDWIDIDETGAVLVNGEKLDEPYVTDPKSVQGDVKYPYQVPEKRYFVLADNRKIASDSRNSAVGCVSEQQMVGKTVFRIWPLNRLSRL